MPQYVRKHGGGSNNLHRRAQSQARGMRSPPIDYQADSILEDISANELFNGA